jgi:antibiotic biosynthesis monooxygenase (ABM) superfamily enzyme
MATASDKALEERATVIIGQQVRDGCSEAFEMWQNDLNAAAGTYPGFLGATITPPTPVQPDWVVVYRFDSLDHLRSWLNSATRQGFLDRGAAYFAGPPTQQVLTRGEDSGDALVTVVVTHRVRTEDTAAFLRWQSHVTAAEGEFPGFRGSEIFRPIEGLQDEWTTLYRFDSAATLDRWLTSGRRRELLDEGDRFHDFQLRTIDSSFGNWFAFDERGREVAPPSNVKSAVVVWVGLYPTAMVLTLGLAALVPGLALWQSLLIGNLLSSFVMTYLTMPRYGNPLFRWWLRPAGDAPQPRTDLIGFVVAIAVNVVWAVVFFLVTDHFWTLP